MWIFAGTTVTTPIVFIGNAPIGAGWERVQSDHSSNTIAKGHIRFMFRLLAFGTGVYTSMVTGCSMNPLNAASSSAPSTPSTTR